MARAQVRVEDFAAEYRELIKLHHPAMQQRDVEALARKLAEITERFGAALAEARARGKRTERGEFRAYRQFKRELEGLPPWFEDYVRQSLL